MFNCATVFGKCFSKVFEIDFIWPLFSRVLICGLPRPVSPVPEPNNLVEHQNPVAVVVKLAWLFRKPIWPLRFCIFCRLLHFQCPNGFLMYTNSKNNVADDDDNDNNDTDSDNVPFL